MRVRYVSNIFWEYDGETRLLPQLSAIPRIVQCYRTHFNRSVCDSVPLPSITNIDHVAPEIAGDEIKEKIEIEKEHMEK